MSLMAESMRWKNIATETFNLFSAWGCSDGNGSYKAKVSADNDARFRAVDSPAGGGVWVT